MSRSTPQTTKLTSAKSPLLDNWGVPDGGESSLSQRINEGDPRRLYRQIADNIAALIVSNQIGIGTRLPAERELALMFGVSRPSIREALIALEVEGFVEVRGGSGVIVSQNRIQRLRQRQEAEPGPFEILKARWHIETIAASLAAKNATADQLKEIRGALIEMGMQSTHCQAATDADRRFHLAIAKASGNFALTLVVQQLWEMRTGGLFMQLESHFVGHDIWAAAQEEHTELMNAIASRNPDDAAAVMRRHISNAEVRLASTWRVTS